MTIHIEKHNFLFFPKLMAICDRCGVKVSSSDNILCPRCFERDPVTIRRGEFLRAYRTGYDLIRRKDIVKCDLCGEELSRSTSKDVCSHCSSKHADNSHIFWSPIYPYSAGVTLFYFCAWCGGLQVIVGIDKRIWDFKYYKVGSPNPTAQSFICTDDLEGTRAVQGACHHEWIIVHDDTIGEEEGRKHERQMKNSSIWRMSDFHIQYAAYGSRRFWCVHCGAFFNLTPQREHLLPKHGLPKEY